MRCGGRTKRGGRCANNTRGGPCRLHARTRTVARRSRSHAARAGEVSRDVVGGDAYLWPRPGAEVAIPDPPEAPWGGNRPRGTPGYLQTEEQRAVGEYRAGRRLEAYDRRIKVLADALERDGYPRAMALDSAEELVAATNNRRRVGVLVSAYLDWAELGDAERERTRRPLVETAMHDAEVDAWGEIRREPSRHRAAVAWRFYRM
eukprot:jgi/Mesvir1/11148/Mv04590-RA.1